MSESKVKEKKALTIGDLIQKQIKSHKAEELIKKEQALKDKKVNQITLCLFVALILGFAYLVVDSLPESSVSSIELPEVLPSK